jgi:hypothetical protein
MPTCPFKNKKDSNSRFRNSLNSAVFIDNLGSRLYNPLSWFAGGYPRQVKHPPIKLTVQSVVESSDKDRLKLNLVPTTHSVTDGHTISTKFSIDEISTGKNITRHLLAACPFITDNKTTALRFTLDKPPLLYVTLLKGQLVYLGADMQSRLSEDETDELVRAELKILSQI